MLGPGSKKVLNFLLLNSFHSFLKKKKKFFFFSNQGFSTIEIVLHPVRYLEY